MIALLLRFIPGLPTALTWLKAFKVECLYLAIAAGLAGAAVGGYAAHKATRHYDAGRIAEARQEAAEARLQLSKFEGQLATERLSAQERESRIMQAAKANHENEIRSINDVATELRAMSAGVRICAAQSTMRLSAAPAGSAQPTSRGEPRPAETVLQELAAEFARRADANAAAFNSLMERWEKLSADK